MKSVLIGNGSLLLVVVDTLIGLGAAAPSPLRTIQQRDTSNWTWEEKYEHENPGAIVGPLVGVRNLDLDISLLNWDGRFPIPKETPPDQVHKMKLDCRGSCKKWDGTRMVDMSNPVPAHSCVRDSLAALAYWRMFCDVNHKHERPECWTRAPSIKRCCGAWYEQGKSPYAPLMKKHKEVIGGLEYWVFTPVREHRKNMDMEQVIRPDWDQYNTKDKICRKWRPGNDAEFSYFINNLPAWNLFDADTNGTVLGLSYDWYDPEGPGRFQLNSEL
ncbi:uncharacterized protein A1O9_02190 [Exophiala aquamarina CBS 119918]|uniref:Uncharacterized protein n=1 Tax=Exophiala aquamarina CBS 119918 TaxID=1182545 RepID=A0A072PKJ1_9EURO|nr:uncharacterized protein A1O9_02190 [Exophiala aquamarina CBS 119918]KEF60629.1 hypothetical protein A1O9_02190 [Exophiala aquamarina CBS 119918]